MIKILKKYKKEIMAVIATVFVVVFVGYFGIARIMALSYTSVPSSREDSKTPDLKSTAVLSPVFVTTHVATPEPVRAIYMSSWVAGMLSFRAKLIKIIDDTEINAVVIDIKDYTGKISFKAEDPALAAIGSAEARIPDIKEFIAMLHKKGIYVIGRIAVFQDPFYIKYKPELAVKKASDKNAPWKDFKGISWIDAGSKDMWDYIIAIGKQSYAFGFDELNFDYIRFPSDGNMKDIYYPISHDRVKHEVMNEFFSYIDTALRPTGVKISADLFGMTATNTDDLNIGQVLEDAIPHFDFVAPMVYPSHFPPTWSGFKNPAEHAREVIEISMGKAVARVKAMGENPLKLRPWLQDFDLGATYTPERVREEINATYKVGLTSWMLWDSGNTYTVGALNK